MPKTVSVNTEKTIPKFLIDYLWGLAHTDEIGMLAPQVFILKAGTLSERPIQNISLLSDIYGEKMYKFFGFDPIDANVYIVYEWGCFTMLVDEDYSLPNVI